jgi:hypothetical protein
MLPDNVRNLLRDHLTSFECLELLLLLHRSAGEPAPVAALVRQTGIAADLVPTALAALEASQLIRRKPTEPVAFYFAPATHDLTRAVDDLQRLYGEQRAAIMSEMSINAIGRIRSGTLRAFADAFVLGSRKRDPDG